LVKDENGDLLADSHNNNCNRWKSYFSQILNFHNVSYIRQREVHTSEPLEPVPSHFHFEIAITKLKEYKSPGSEQIPAELTVLVCFKIDTGELSSEHSGSIKCWKTVEWLYRWWPLD
jgi:hypothetical protein